MTTFQESRKVQIVNALREAGAEQIKPIKPKSEAQLEADRCAAAGTKVAAIRLHIALKYYSTRVLYL
jgi:hypothetical protein